MIWLCTVLVFCCLVGLHSSAMMYYEGLSGSDAIWFSLTTMTTVGYGDISPKTGAGRALTGLLAYLPGIAVTGVVAGYFVDLINKGFFKMPDKRKRVIIYNDQDYTKDDELERRLYIDLDDKKEKEYSIEFWPCGVNADDVIIIECVADSDAIIACDAMRTDYPNARIIVALKDMMKRRQALKWGASQVVRRADHCMWIAKAIKAPGIETVLENMFSNEDDVVQRMTHDEMGFAKRESLNIQHTASWGWMSDCSIKKHGILLGYVATNGDVHDNLKHDDILHWDDIEAFLVWVRK